MDVSDKIPWIHFEHTWETQTKLWFAAEAEKVLQAPGPPRLYSKHHTGH